MACTNNSVEEWLNAFNSGIGNAHPTFVKLLKYIQREQSLQEAKYANEAQTMKVKNDHRTG